MKWLITFGNGAKKVVDQAEKEDWENSPYKSALKFEPMPEAKKPAGIKKAAKPKKEAPKAKSD